MLTVPSFSGLTGKAKTILWQSSPDLWILPFKREKEISIANELIEITQYLINSNLPIPSYFNTTEIRMHTKIGDKYCSSTV